MDRVNRPQESSITPFWQRIPAFYLYGLNWMPVSLALGLCLLTFLLDSWWGYLIAYAITIKYSMEALRATGRGNLEPPGFTSDVLLHGYELPVALYAILFLFYAMLSAMQVGMGVWFATTVYAVGVLLFPAMVICLGISESMMFAMNPLNMINLIRAVGWPYLALFGLLFAMGIAQSTVESALPKNADTAAMASMWLLVNTLFSVISFHMMGYLVYQYHERLGEPLHPELSAGVVVQTAGSGLLDRFVDEGNVQAAIGEFRSLLQDEPDNIELRTRLHNYALLHQQHRVLEENARRLLVLAVRMQKPTLAARVFSDCESRQVSCRPEDSTLYPPILDALRKQHRHREAVALAKGFHKRFPGSDLIPEVYLGLARILAEDMQRDDLAKRLLQYLLNSWGNHPLAGDARSLLNILDNLATD